MFFPEYQSKSAFFLRISAKYLWNRICSILDMTFNVVLVSKERRIDMKAEAFSTEVVTPVRFRIIKEKTSKPLTDWMKGFTLEVSLEGVKINAPMSEEEIETLVRRYAHIKLFFQLPDTPRAIAATATIVYFQRGATVSKYTMITFGLSFVAIDYSARDVISEFIHQRVNSSTLNKIYHFPIKKTPDTKMKPLIPCLA
jgi:hypothetical protein